jgi:phosphotransferase system HPr-like phosphotransfer protein
LGDTLEFIATGTQAPQALDAIARLLTVETNDSPT